MTSETPALSHVEQILLRKLRSRRGDVAINVLFSAAFGVAHCDLPLPRAQQMRLGPRITTLNRKIESTGERVVPGRVKRTYRLERAAARETAPAAE